MGGDALQECIGPLHPGDSFTCQLCSQRSTAILNEGILECSSCLLQIQEYDTVEHDRVPLDQEGRLSGRGPGRRGGNVQGSVIGPTGRGRRNKWGRLASIDRAGRGGPSRSKLQTMELIRTLAATPTHERLALDLLETGWPDKGSKSALTEAVRNPMWQPAHPRGVPSSAAVCLHLSAYEMGFDSKFEEWVKKCLPGVKKASSYAFRCLKRMRAIMGESRLRRESMDGEARAILSRANLGETEYAPIMGLIWEEWCEVSSIRGNTKNHPRPVLAALCEKIAEREGIRISGAFIESRFNVSRSYKAWKDKL